MNNALTVDVEDYYHVAAFSNDISPAHWDRYESRVEKNTMRLLSLFEKYNTKATFFTLGWVAKRNPDLICEISNQGHEVACHGYSHQLIYNQDINIFYNETKRAKEILEDIVNKNIRGYRAASYSITKNSLWALDTLIDLGFDYDSSMVPVHHDLYGIPELLRSPHQVMSPNGKYIVEFPPTTVSFPGFNLPVAGGGYFRLYPYWFSKNALKWVNSRDKIPFIFYLHPWEIDPDQPRIESKWLSRFRHYNNLSKCYTRLDRLLNDFEFTSAHDVLVNENLLIADKE